MVQVVIPLTTQESYLHIDNSLIGPIAAFLNDPRSRKTYELVTEGFLKEEPGIGGDNNVDHVKIDGIITWCSLLASANYSEQKDDIVPWQSGRLELNNLTSSDGSTKSFVTSPSLVGTSGYDYVLSTEGVKPFEYHDCAIHQGFNVVGSTLTYCYLSVYGGDTLRGPRGIRQYRLIEVDLSSRSVSGPQNPQYSCKKIEYNDPWFRITLPEDWDKAHSLADLIEVQQLIAYPKQDTYLWLEEFHYGGTLQLPDIDVVMKFVQDAVQNLTSEVLSPTGCDYGDLAMEASKKARTCQTNVISLLRDIRHPAEMIPKLKNLAHLKAHANNYLTVKYGVLPTISDLQEIVAAFKKMAFYDKNGYRTLNAGYTTNVSSFERSETLTQRIKIAVKQEDSMLQNLYQKFCSVGVFPTLANLWDLVPYSFVLDWFVDVGGFLEVVDTRLLFSTMNIGYTTKSSKLTTVIHFLPCIATPYLGNITRVHYHRWVSDQCPVPPLVLKSTTEDFDHWVESGALVIQRKH